MGLYVFAIGGPIAILLGLFIAALVSAMRDVKRRREWDEGLELGLANDFEWERWR